MSQIVPSGNDRHLANSSWFFSCKNRGEQKNFERFQRKAISFTTLVIFVIITSASAVLNKALTYKNYPTILSGFNAVCSGVFEIVLAYSLLVVFSRLRKQSESDGKKMERLISIMENVYILGYNLSLVMSAFVFISNGYCPAHVVYLETIGCNSSSVNHFPESTMAMMLMVPFMLSMIIKSARSETIFYIWVQNFGVLVYFFTTHNFRLSVGSLIGFSLVTFISLYELQRQKIAMYFLAQDLYGVKNENERLAEENRASELKHLIGNVAHDLKTPLSSLNMGIDLIYGVLEELTSITTNSVPLQIKDNIFHIIASVEENLLNMKNVNSFMLMNINRCMDYTKASNGLKLVPKNETAPLLETIALPLHVMSAMHGKTHIELKPVPHGIASHIITDKQWLQENILCLLSNSVKYSNRGVVSIQLSLVERGIVDDTAVAVATVRPKGIRSKVKAKPRQKSIISVTFQPWRPISYHQKLRSSHDSIDSIERSLNEHTILRINSPYNPDPDISINRNITTIKEKEKTTITMLRVQIEDFGIGMSDEVMATLFSPFKQAQRLAGGTGLGLFSLSRRIDAVGGHYGVQKRSDGHTGSVFWFEIPYKPDLEYANNLGELSARTLATLNAPFHRKTTRVSELSKSKSSPVVSIRKSLSKSTDDIPTVSSMNTAMLKKGLNVLLADDTLSIQKMTSMLLRKQGHIVTIADNGAEALDLIIGLYNTIHECKRSGKKPPPCYDVVLMDFQMPIMDGLEATRRIRAFEMNLNIHASSNDEMTVTDFDSTTTPTSFHQLIIGLSANSDEETVQLAREAGVDDFMEKPFKAVVFDEIFYKLRPS